MDSDGKFIQKAVKKIKKGALTKQALRAHETPLEFAKEVLAEPEKFTKTTRKRAQFAINITKHSQPDVETKMEEPKEHHKKAKRSPSAWNTLVSKHIKALGKGHFKEAIAAAKAEYAHHKTGHKAEHKAHEKMESKKEEKMEHKPKRARKPRAPKAPKEESKPNGRVRNIELHI